MEKILNVTSVQILKNGGDVLANIGINDQFLLQLKISDYYIPSSNEDCWGQNSSKQDEFKENVELPDLLNKLGLIDVKSITDLRQYCENNYILVEIV